MQRLRLPDVMMAAVRSKNNRLCARTDAPGARERTFKRRPTSPEWHHRDPRGHIAAAAPTAAPPTTARRVVRRATPATLTGVNGRPTLACALSTATEGTPPGDQFIDARVPKARVAVANNACLMLIFLIATSCAEQANDNDPRSAGLI